MIQHCHRDRSDHGDLLAVVLEDEDHVKVLEAELDTLEMNKFDILECGDERRPGGKVNLNKTYYNNLLDLKPPNTYQAARGWLQQTGLTVRNPLRRQNRAQVENIFCLH